jgi:hypothetical protein
MVHANSHCWRAEEANNVECGLAGSTGLEPAASGVTGRRSNQLNYDPAIDWMRVLARLLVGGNGFEPLTAGV